VSSPYYIKPNSAHFLYGVPSFAQLKRSQVPEIALVGRSNVGKSTFLNKVLGNKFLARKSATPGKTKEINLFEAELMAPKGESSTILVADLPGYGFAKVSKEERARMSRLTIEYISERPSLEVVVILNDSKRLPEEDEFTIANSALESGRSLLIVLTKVDRLSQSERVKNVREIASAYGVREEELILSSDKSDAKLFWKMVGSALFADDESD
jgi:GTP-binding protein